MDLLRREILNITKTKPEIGLGYYNDLLKIIDDHYELKPDVSVETCKAIIEGICKLILHRVEQEPLHILDKYEIKELTKLALTSLNGNVEFFDQDFVRGVINVVRIVGESRNKHCDIGHGRASLKEQLNCPDFSEMISRFTEAITVYLLRKLNQVSESENAYESEQMKEYNEWLDKEFEDFPIQTVSYSKILFEYDPDLYYLKYHEDYLKQQEEVIDESEATVPEEPMNYDPIPFMPESKFFKSEHQVKMIVDFVLQHRIDIEKLIPEIDKYFFSNEKPSKQKLSELFHEDMSNDKRKSKTEILELALPRLITSLIKTSA